MPIGQCCNGGQFKIRSILKIWPIAAFAGGPLADKLVLQLQYLHLQKDNRRLREHRRESETGRIGDAAAVIGSTCAEVRSSSPNRNEVNVFLDAQ